MKECSAGKQIWVRCAIILELIVCYMAVLTVISYLRGPIRKQIIQEMPLLRIEDFTSFRGETAKVPLWFDNATPGTAVGYSAELQLENLGGVHVLCSFECPEECAGGILHVDLYNADAGYDSDEQEYSFVLQAGVNDVSFSLAPGEAHPQMAWLRIFTLDSARYNISDLYIYREEVLPQVSKKMIVGVIVCFLILGVTMAVQVAAKKKK